MAPGGAKPFSGTGKLCASVKRVLILASRTLALALLGLGATAAAAQAQDWSNPSVSTSFQSDGACIAGPNANATSTQVRVEWTAFNNDSIPGRSLTLVLWHDGAGQSGAVDANNDAPVGQLPLQTSDVIVYSYNLTPGFDAYLGLYDSWASGDVWSNTADPYNAPDLTAPATGVSGYETLDMTSDPDCVAPPPTVTLSVSTISASEGDGSVVLTATQSSSTSQATTVNLSYSGTASGSGVDYSGPASITIPANAEFQTAQISFVDDPVDESDETIIVDIASVSGGNGATENGVQRQTITLTDNDPTPSLRVENAQVFEDAGVLAFPVNLSAASARTITVDYASGGAMASSGTDFTAASGTLTFSPGETSKSIPVTVIDDGVVERNEMLSMTLSSATNATISRALGTGTINNDDSATLSITDVQNQEGAGLTFTLTLSAPVDTDIRYYARTTNGTAQAGDDYTALASGSSRTISAGVQTVSLPVTINDDGVPEPDETFTVTLFDLDAGGARDVTLGDASATGTILNDDQYPDVTLSASPTTISENGGTSTLTAILSATSTQDVTVSLGYSNANATGPASIVVPAGDLTATGTVTAVDNAVDEPDRTVEVSVVSVTNGVEDGVQAVTLTVTDDEDAPSLSIADVSLTEGASGTKAMTFTASLSAASARTVTVDYATSSGTATANVDFDTASGTLTFAPGQTQQTFDVTISGENRVELDESFTVTLSSATNATIADATATGTILNDDSATISIADGQRLEGDSSDNSLNLLVSMSAPVDVSVSLTVTTADGTATAPADYYAVSAAPYSIADGQMGRFIPVSTKADTVFEPDETFTVTLADLDASGRAVTFSDATATVTIRNDDAAPNVTLSASPTTIPENGGTSTLTATLSTTSTEDVTVALAYSNANATGPASIVVPAGDLTATGTVTAVDNAIDEPDRTVQVSVDSVTNGTESGTQAVTLTLTDDEGASSLSIADASLSEGASGTSVMTFTASLSPASGQTVTVDYATSDNTATAGSDYTAALGTLTFTPGQTQQMFDVTVSGDNVVELSETFTVTLSSATNATISDASATGTITNDDSATLTLADSGLYETEADQLVSLRATLSAPVDTSVRFEASTADGTATAPSDYTAVVDRPWSINTGLTTLDLVFTVKGDAAFEPDEAFTVLLTNLTASGRDVTFADASANVRILNNDSTPNVTLSASPTTIPENGGTSTLTATLSTTSTEDVTVALAYSNAEVTGPASIVVPAGSPSATALVTAVDNALDEPDRTVVVSVDTVTNGTENATQAVTLTVTDDEGAPTLSVANVTIDESDGAAVLAMILDTPSAQPVTVFWSTEDDSAVASDDYTAVFDKAEVIPAGETHLDLIVTINDDALEEVAETFTLKFSGVSGAVAANSEAVVTIRASDLDTPTVKLSTSAPDRVSGMFEVAIDFSESVTGFDMTDFALVNAIAGNLAGSGASYTVEITPTGNGVVSIELPAASIEDAAGNANTASNTITRQADGTAPELTILLPDAETHGAFTASFTFSEDVTGFELADISVTNGAVSAFAGSGADYTVLVTPAAVGTVELRVGDGAGADAAGNTSLAAAANVEAVASANEITLVLASSVGDPGTVFGSSTLTNPGSAPFGFVATADVPWLDFDQVSGDVPSSGSIDLTISLNEQVYALGSGDHVGKITISADGLFLMEIPVSLSVEARHGEITLIATTPSGSSGQASFGYTSDIMEFDGLTLNSSAGRASASASGLTQGQYAITQSLPAGWRLDSISCTGDADSGSSFDVRTGSAVMDLDPNESLVCTFKNVRDEQAVRMATQRAIRNFMLRRADIIISSAPDLSRRFGERQSQERGGMSANMSGTGVYQMNFSILLEKIFD